MNVRGIGVTHTGMLRSQNEDSMLVDNGTGLYVIADGLGGHAAGEVASTLAVDAVAEFIRDRRKLLARFRQGWGGENELSELASRAVQHACRVVYEAAVANTEYYGMGCTLTVLLVGKTKAGIAHVGDSRLYLDRRGRVRQLTSDHSYACELVRLGIIDTEDIPHVQGGQRLIRAVGLKPTVQVDELLVDLKAGDRFVLCSDGLSMYFEHPRELDDLIAANKFELLPTRLVEFANTAGGLDNITALVVEVEKSSLDALEIITADITPVVNRCRNKRTPSSSSLS